MSVSPAEMKAGHCSPARWNSRVTIPMASDKEDIDAIQFHGNMHGRKHAMKITMDRAGRLVIPSEIRREAGLEPGMPLEIHVEDGRIEIEPKTMQVKLKRRGHLLVAVPLVPVPPMDHEIVERTLRKIRNSRGK
jgi:AbrB family looped-hinge helix DNA binding protein